MPPKVFRQLVAEFRRLGATIVLATFNRIIICTHKTTLPAAQEYIEFITETITNNQLFSRLLITPREYQPFWASLLFFDANNYGGTTFGRPVPVEEEGPGAGDGGGEEWDEAGELAEQDMDGELRGPASTMEKSDEQRRRERRKRERKRKSKKNNGMVADDDSDFDNNRDTDDDADLHGDLDGFVVDDDEVEQMDETEVAQADARLGATGSRRSRGKRGKKDRRSRRRRAAEGSDDEEEEEVEADSMGSAGSAGDESGEDREAEKEEEGGGETKSERSSRGSKKKASKSKSKKKLRRRRQRSADQSSDDSGGSDDAWGKSEDGEEKDATKTIRKTTESASRRRRRSQSGDDDSATGELFDDDDDAEGVVAEASGDDAHADAADAADAGDALPMEVEEVAAPAEPVEPVEPAAPARALDEESDSEAEDGLAEMEAMETGEGGAGAGGATGPDGQPLAGGDDFADVEYGIVSHWNLAEFLPVEIQEPFMIIVGEFLLKPLRHRQKWLKEERRRAMQEALDQVRREEEAAAAAREELLEREDGGDMLFGSSQDGGGMGAATQMSQRVAMDAAVSQALRTAVPAEEEKQYLQWLVSRHLTNKLLRLIPDIADHNLGREDFPRLAGSHLDLKHPALEFVKSVCEVLALDDEVKDEVQLLKRNLLKSIQIREFSKDAIYNDPCTSFVLPDVICSYCNFSKDLDLCRDPELTSTGGDAHAHSAEDSDIESRTRDWRCSTCGHAYNKGGIEQQLVQIVQRRSAAYQVRREDRESERRSERDCSSLCDMTRWP